MLSFHELSSLLFAFFSWNMTTEGVFQAVLKPKASLSDTGLTRKSLKRCHSLSSEAVGSAWATGQIC